MDKVRFDDDDYSVVVKNRAPPPNSWRWEIYRASSTGPHGPFPQQPHVGDAAYDKAAAKGAGSCCLASRHERWQGVLAGHGAYFEDAGANEAAAQLAGLGFGPRDRLAGLIAGRKFVRMTGLAGHQVLGQQAD
jgi:hypothetical protein